MQAIQQKSPKVSSLRLLFSFFLANKIFILFSAWIVSYIVPLSNRSLALGINVDTPYLRWIWANFDGVHYLEIAGQGYQYPNFAYFPLLPFLIAIGNKILHVRLVESGLILTNICLFLGMVILYKITEKEFGESIAVKTIIVLIVFPLSFFYSAVYTDALYFFLSVTCFYFAKNKQYFNAGIFGLLAGLSRLIGIVLLLVLGIEWISSQKKRSFSFLLSAFLKEKAYWILLIPCGIAAYSLFLHLNFGDFLLFQKSMGEWGQSGLVYPLQVFFRYGKILLFGHWDIAYFVAFIELIFSLFYFALALYVTFRIRLSYGVFMFLTYLIPSLTGTLQSMPRYGLHTFPLFIALALISNKFPKWAQLLIMICSLLLQAIFIGFFTRGYFIS